MEDTTEGVAPALITPTDLQLKFYFFELRSYNLHLSLPKLRLLLISSHPTWKIPSLSTLKSLFPTPNSPIDALPLPPTSKSPPHILSNPSLKYLFHFLTYTELQFEKELIKRERKFATMRYWIMLMACGLKPVCSPFGDEDLREEWFERVWAETRKLIERGEKSPKELIDWLKSIIIIRINENIMTSPFPNSTPQAPLLTTFLNARIFYSSHLPSPQLKLLHWAFLSPSSNPLSESSEMGIYIPPYSTAAALGYTNTEPSWRGLHEEAAGWSMMHDFADYRLNALVGWGFGLVSDWEKVRRFMDVVREKFEAVLEGRVNFFVMWKACDREGRGNEEMNDSRFGSRLAHVHLNVVVLPPPRIDTPDNSTDITTNATSTLISHRPPSTSLLSPSFNTSPFSNFPSLPKITFEYSQVRHLTRRPFDSVTVKFWKTEGKDGGVFGRVEVEERGNAGGREGVWKINRIEKGEWRELEGVDLKMRHGV